jgi:hypothetical protein
MNNTIHVSAMDPTKDDYGYLPQTEYITEMWNDPSEQHVNEVMVDEWEMDSYLVYRYHAYIV